MQTLSKEEIKADFPALFGQPHHYLAISGGGADGAFGAGLLVGWTRTGNRPMFQMVTGISTGALIAPFAFLGPDYDPILKAVYTTISTKDILIERPLLKILGADAVADSTPLWALIQRYVGDEVVAAIAAAHRTGRRLFIGTSDLDYMRPPDLGYWRHCLQRKGRRQGSDPSHHARIGFHPRRFPSGIHHCRGRRLVLR